jgi:hypothetical protein
VTGRGWTLATLVASLALVAATCNDGGAPADPNAQAGRALSVRYFVHWTGPRVHRSAITVTVVSSRHAPKVWTLKVDERSFAGHVDLYKGDYVTVTASQLESGGLYLDLTAGDLILDAPKQREDPGSITAHYERPRPNQAAPYRGSATSSCC